MVTVIAIVMVIVIVTTTTTTTTTTITTTTISNINIIIILIMYSMYSLLFFICGDSRVALRGFADLWRGWRAGSVTTPKHGWRNSGEQANCGLWIGQIKRGLAKGFVWVNLRIACETLPVDLQTKCEYPLLRPPPLMTYELCRLGACSVLN